MKVREKERTGGRERERGEREREGEEKGGRKREGDRAGSTHQRPKLRRAQNPSNLFRYYRQGSQDYSLFDLKRASLARRSYVASWLPHSGSVLVGGEEMPAQQKKAAT